MRHVSPSLPSHARQQRMFDVVSGGASRSQSSRAGLLGLQAAFHATLRAQTESLSVCAGSEQSKGWNVLCNQALLALPHGWSRLVARRLCALEVQQSVGFQAGSCGLVPRTLMGTRGGPSAATETPVQLVLEPCSGGFLIPGDKAL